MRTYYLFIIKNEFYNTYLKNPDSLYKTLENLKYCTKQNYSFGLTLYHQLCEMHDIKTLKAYFRSKRFLEKGRLYLVTGPFEEEKTVVELRPSILVIRTNRNIPKIFRILNYYNRYMFVCDFKSNDYFWLANQFHKKKRS